MHNMIYFYRYLPNTLTLLRMVSAPFLCYAILLHEPLAAFMLITFAILSDMGDGYMARRLFVSSRAGSFLDPLADKAVIIAAFVALCQLRVMPWWVLMVVVWRDMLVTFLRIFLLRYGVTLKTSWFAKSKTAFQFIGLYLFVGGLAYPQLATDRTWQQFFYSLSLLTAFLTVASAVGYGKALAWWCVQRSVHRGK
jgi:CDP-diacylglycerol--glycerol-3-phosphate 3-phosphatidyltransferase